MDLTTGMDAPGYRMDRQNDHDHDQEPVRAVVADDDAFARRMIKESLTNSGVIVVAEALNGREAVELALFYRPDVVVMDVVMPGLDGVAATRQIIKEIPEQVIVLLTSSEEEDMGLLGLRAGAAGYLTKDVDIGSLPRALRGALAGEAVITRRMGMRLVEQLRHSGEGTIGLRPVKSPLTPREWEVIDLLCEERTTDEIAQTLVLSTETVRSHVKNILRKLDVRTRRDAVAAVQRMRGA